MRTTCSTCGRQVSLTHRLGMAAACGLVGSVLGKAATKHPVGVLACGLLGFLVGNMIQEYIESRCPSCGAMLRIAGGFLT